MITKMKKMNSINNGYSLKLFLFKNQFIMLKVRNGIIEKIIALLIFFLSINPERSIANRTYSVIVYNLTTIKYNVLFD